MESTPCLGRSVRKYWEPWAEQSEGAYESNKLVRLRGRRGAAKIANLPGEWRPPLGRGAVESRQKERSRLRASFQIELWC